MQEKTEAQVTDEWANAMLDEATDSMDEASIHITSTSLSEYFEKNYELPLSPEVAQIWLSEQSWYKGE